MREKLLTTAAVVGAALLLGAAVLVLRPETACALGYCPPTVCIDSGICLGDCVCLKQGSATGRCVSLNAVPEAHR